MLLQNRIFTAEAPRTQRKHVLFGGRYRQTKRIPSFQCEPQNRSHRHQKVPIFFPKAYLPAGRDGVFDPIVVPPWRDWIKRKTRFSVLCGSAVSLILKGQSKKCNEINRSRRGFLGKPCSKIEQRTGDFKKTIGRMKAL
jgi:hypothetical protein